MPQHIAVELRVVSPYRAGAVAYEVGQLLHLKPAEADFLLRDSPGCFEVAAGGELLSGETVAAPENVVDDELVEADTDDEDEELVAHDTDVDDEDEWEDEDADEDVAIDEAEDDDDEADDDGGAGDEPEAKPVEE